MRPCSQKVRHACASSTAASSTGSAHPDRGRLRRARRCPHRRRGCHVGAARADEVPAIDVGGCCLMPGLIDCHAHLVYSGFRSLEEVDRSSVESAAIEAMRNARRCSRRATPRCATWVPSPTSRSRCAMRWRRARSRVRASSRAGRSSARPAGSATPSRPLGAQMGRARRPRRRARGGAQGGARADPERGRQHQARGKRGRGRSLRLYLDDHLLGGGGAGRHPGGASLGPHGRDPRAILQFGQVRAARRRGYGRARHAPGRGGAGTLQAGSSILVPPCARSSACSSSARRSSSCPSSARRWR